MMLHMKLELGPPSVAPCATVLKYPIPGGPILLVFAVSGKSVI